MDRSARFLVLFTCVSMAHAYVEWPKTQALNLDTPTPPFITEPKEQKNIYVTMASDVTIHCAAYGNPTPSYTWYWNDQEVLANATHMTSWRDSGALTIHNFDSASEGFLRCTATNDFGRSLSPTLHILMRRNPSFNNDDNKVKTLKVKEGEGVALECFDHPRFVPPGKYAWYHKTHEDQQQISTYDNNRLEIDANGTLYITRAEKGDEQIDYSCAMLSSELNVVQVAGTPYLNVEVEKNTALETKPTLLGATGFITAQKGGDALLECYFGGSPMPNITWMYGDRSSAVINGTNRRVILSSSGHKLRISRLIDDDEGRYRCLARNSMGTSEATTFLNVTSKPVFETSSPQIIIAPKGSDATFSCVAKGSFKERTLDPPVWTINGNKLPENDSKLSLNPEGTKLTVHQVTKKDRMSVQCTVTNSVGYAFGDGFLTVIDPLAVTSRPDSLLVAGPNTTWVNMTVAATTDSCCKAIFSWSLNGRNLAVTALHKRPYMYTLGDNTATLSILVNGTEAEVKGVMGRYQCDVFHEAYQGKSTVVTDVKSQVAKEPKKEKVTAAEASYGWVAGVVGGILVLIIAIVIIACMVRHNYPRQAYLLDKQEKKHKLNPEQDLLDQSFEEI